jgi:hypothetical protein
MTKIILRFPNVSKEDLKKKLDPAVENFNLSAEYQDEEVAIVGPERAINAIQQAYLTQKLMSDLGVRF